MKHNIHPKCFKIRHRHRHPMLTSKAAPRKADRASGGDGGRNGDKKSQRARSAFSLRSGGGGGRSSFVFPSFMGRTDERPNRSQNHEVRTRGRIQSSPRPPAFTRSRVFNFFLPWSGFRKEVSGKKRCIGVRIVSKGELSEHANMI